MTETGVGVGLLNTAEGRHVFALVDTIFTPHQQLLKRVLTGRLVRQPSWQEIVDESSIQKACGESFWPRVMRGSPRGGH